MSEEWRKEEWSEGGRDGVREERKEGGMEREERSEGGRKGGRKE